MKIIKYIVSLFHICNQKPIRSAYVGFNTRDILYKCKCGKGKITREYHPYGSPFTIETTPFITYKDLEKILKEKVK